MSDTCSGCQFFNRELSCRLNPPVGVQGFGGQGFPFVAANWWCGAWVAAPHSTIRPPCATCNFFNPNANECRFLPPTAQGFPYTHPAWNCSKWQAISGVFDISVNAIAEVTLADDGTLVPVVLPAGV